MADNYLENQYEQYQARKAAWERERKYGKKKHKAYYYQVQEQLFCTHLKSCNLVFLSVTTYDDEANWHRNILPNEYCKIRITRDEQAIAEIKRRGQIFQQIKDFYSN